MCVCMCTQLCFFSERKPTGTHLPTTTHQHGTTQYNHIEIVSNSGIRWIWRVVEGMEALGRRTIVAARRPACGTESPKQTPCFYAKKALLCDPKLPVQRRIHAFYSTCAAAVLHGAGEWAFTQAMFPALRIWEIGKLCRVLDPNECWADHMKRTGVIVARQLIKHNQSRLQTLAMRRVRIAAWQMVSFPSDSKGDTGRNL